MTESGITNETYWTGRYATGDTPWDAGEATTPIREYVDQLTDRQLSVLIPGAGNAHEALYMWRKGFRNLHVLDLSDLPLKKFNAQVPDFPKHQLIHGDFFDHSGNYDLIIEQTFFCVLHPSQRGAYVSAMAGLLQPAGKLVGVLFDDPLFSDHPPYGGDEETYRSVFFPAFRKNVMARCYNSIPPRAGRELWINLQPD